MPSCYLLCACVGSALDQESNNMTLFSMVEQINVPPNAPPPPNGVIPLEVHAYWRVAPREVSQTFSIRFVMVAVHTGLETSSAVFNHRALTERFRTRTLGLPCPPVAGNYELFVEWRMEGSEDWKRESTPWPLTLAEAVEPPRRVLN